MAQVSVNSFIWSFTGAAAHILAGHLLTSTIHRHGGGLRGMLIGTAIGLAAAAFKEFYYDEKYEDPVTRGSSPLDFAEYAIGIALGWFV